MTRNSFERIGAGNSLTGNDLQDEYLDGVVVENQDDGITMSATWPDLGVPYLVSDGLDIYDGNGMPPTLTIAPGVLLELDGGSVDLEDAALAIGANAEIRLEEAEITSNPGP